VVSACPYQEGSGLFACGCETRVVIFNRLLEKQSNTFLENERQFATWNLNETEFQNSGRITSLAWSPQCSCPTITDPGRETQIGICASSADFSIGYFFSKLQEKKYVTLSGHKSFINSCHFSPVLDGLYLASTGDDHSCRIWDVNAEQEMTLLPLKSSGQAVRWHPSTLYPEIIMVAEESGTIKFYDLRSRKVTASYSTDSGPLTDADWVYEPSGRPNMTQFGCVAGNHWYLWKRTETYQIGDPLVGDISFPGFIFRFSPSTPSLFVTSAATTPNLTLWNQFQSKITTPAELPFSVRITGLSWFSDENCVVLSGGQNKIYFWSIRGL